MITCSFRTALRQNYEVVGRERVIEVSLAFVPEGEEAPLVIHRGPETEVITFPKSDQYQLMVEHFADCVISGRSLRFSPGEALANMRVLDALAQSARTGKLIHLS